MKPDNDGACFEVEDEAPGNADNQGQEHKWRRAQSVRKHVVPAPLGATTIDYWIEEAVKIVAHREEACKISGPIMKNQMPIIPFGQDAQTLALFNSHKCQTDAMNTTTMP